MGLGDQRAIQPSRLSKARQQQGVEPDDKACYQSRGRPLAGGATPVKSDQQRGGKLSDARKRDQSNGDQAVSVANQRVVEIPHQQNHDDGDSAYPQQPIGQLAVAADIEPFDLEQQRHDQLVAYHGRERDGFHDHHPRGRGQPTDEHQQGQALETCGERQRQHEAVRVSGIQQQPRQGNGNHEQVDQQHVERKQPAGANQVLLIDVLDDQYLELTWQGQKARNASSSMPTQPVAPPGTLSSRMALASSGMVAACANRAAGPRTTRR